MITDDIFIIMMSALFLILALLVTAILYTLCYGMARIYNWNGNHYCYLGYAPIKREGSGFSVWIGERMVELSRTTAYRICPTQAFCRKNRYRDLYVYADGSRNYLVVENGAMKTEIPF